MIQSSYSFSSGSGLQPHLGPPPRGRGSPKQGPPLSISSRLEPHTCPIHFRTSSDSAPAPEGFEPSARNLEEGLMGLSELTPVSSQKEDGTAEFCLADHQPTW